MSAMGALGIVITALAIMAVGLVVILVAALQRDSGANWFRRLKSAPKDAFAITDMPQLADDVEIQKVSVTEFFDVPDTDSVGSTAVIFNPHSHSTFSKLERERIPFQDRFPVFLRAEEWRPTA